MMKKIFPLILILAYLLIPATSYAYNPLNAACGAGSTSGTSTRNSSACQTTGKDPISGQNGALMKVSVILSTIAGVAAVIIIFVSGLRYVLSGGDPQKVASARSAIIGSVVGLAIIAGAEGILLFVLSKLQ